VCDIFDDSVYNIDYEHGMNYSSRVYNLNNCCVKNIEIWIVNVGMIGSNDVDWGFVEYCV